MAKEKERVAAEALFNTGWSQRDIAQALNLDETTVSTWAQKHKWREKRAQRLLARENSEEAILQMIEHQTNVLLKIATRQRQEIEDLGDKATLDQLKSSLLQNGQLDGLQKLFTTLKGKELGWEDHVNVCTDLLNFCDNRGGLNLQGLKELIGDYLQSKR